MPANHMFCDLNDDVLYHILEQVAALRSTADVSSVALKRLSLTCRRMRSYCMPILFHNCKVRANQGVPPEAIRTFVRHIQYMHCFYSIDELSACGYYQAKTVPMPLFRDTSAAPPPFGLELDYLPAVHSVTFYQAPGGVPWSALMRCMAHPTITAISIDEGPMWRCAPPPTPSDLPLRNCRLTKFSYTPPQWRETERVVRRTDLQRTYALESTYLHALVLAMADTAESLTLPVETAPLLEMAAMDWPRLHTLSLVGRYTDPEQCRAIALLLLRAPYLRSLSIKVMQAEGMRRPALLKTLPDTSYCLRSLTVSYPDPNDPIFSYIGDGLTHLSLRDSPRHYFKSRYSSHCLLAAFPILVASECLAILKRISAPRLTALELVYEADEAEEDLLRHLPRAFPLLQDLELHRYKASPEDDVPYLHIAERLMAIKYLRALYLNVDIMDDAFNGWIADRDRSSRRMRLRNERGRELVRLLQASEYFEYLALPLHMLPAGVWVLYRPAWYRGMPVQQGTPYALDSEAFYTELRYR